MQEQAQARVIYTINFSQASEHLYGVSLKLPTHGLQDLTLQMPAWIPGSYMIREFARHVTAFVANTPGVRLEQISKDSWRISPEPGAKGSKLPKQVELSYKTYAFDTSVRGAYLDSERAFFNGTSIFFEALELDAAYEVKLLRPANSQALSKARVATALAPTKCDKQGFGNYFAPDFDCLIDQPVEISEHLHRTFTAGGAVHHVVIAGMGALAASVDMERLVKDFKTIADEQLRLFEPRSGKAPMKAYWFLTNALSNGYGGLEHRDSTVLLCNRSDLPLLHGGPTLSGDSSAYRGFLGLVSHEYFHAWNVKRIKPAAFVPYATDQESYTRLLWIFEGFTSYYDDLVLARSARITVTQYLSLLANALTVVEREPGAKQDTVADSSFSAWTRYYRQDENSPNTLVNYYGKGSLVAFCLDLSIRAKTKGRRSLDDVMRLLWKKFGERFYLEPENQCGLSEEEFPSMVKQATGLDLSQEIQDWAYSAKALPWETLLDTMGISVQRSAETYAALGVKLATKPGEITLSTVYSGGAAQKAGLSNGDQLIAVGGLKANEAVLQTMLAQNEGNALDMHVFRRDELKHVVVELPSKAQKLSNSIALNLKEKPSKTQSKALESWLAPWTARSIN